MAIAAFSVATTVIATATNGHFIFQVRLTRIGTGIQCHHAMSIIHDDIRLWILVADVGKSAAQTLALHLYFLTREKRIVDHTHS